MARDKQTTRSLISFLIAWSFLALVATGIVLFLVPKGRIARMVDWSLLGLDKWQWGDVHIVFGSVFIVTGIWHLYLNWSPFKHYWAERAKNGWRIKRELLISIAMIVTLTGLTVADLPPASWVSGLRDSLKQQGWSIPGGGMSQAGQSQRGGKGRGYGDSANRGRGKGRGHYESANGGGRLAESRAPEALRSIE